MDISMTVDSPNFRISLFEVFFLDCQPLEVCLSRSSSSGDALPLREPGPTLSLREVAAFAQFELGFVVLLS